MKKISIKALGRHITVKIMMIILIIVLPLNIISIFSSLRLTKEFENQVVLNLQNTTDVYMNTLDTNIQKAHMYMYEMVTGDQDCLRLKMQNGDYEYENAKYRCYMALIQRLRQEDLVDGYFYLMKKQGDCVFAAADLSDAQRESVTSYIFDTEDHDNYWHYVSIDGEEYLLRIAKEKDFRYGAIIRLEKIIREIQEVTPLQGLTLAFNKELNTGKNSFLQAHTLSEYSDLVLYAGVETHNYYSELSIWTKLLLTGAFIMIMAIPIIYISLNYLLIQPLNSLNVGFGQMKRGNRGYKITEKANTAEFQEAYDSFNQMMGSMENLRLENMEKELEKKKLEVSNLQLQIRPHFLLNTFNMMYVLCSENNVRQVQELILYLSNYFRYIFRSGRELEIFEKELTLIEGYIRAAQIRYIEGVTILYQIEPEVRLVRIPPLLIHNFVENAVSHGRVQGKSLNIVLAASYENGIVSFQVSDDGIGMEEETVRQINECRWQEESTGHHIGIKNAVRRLKYFYGDRASVFVDSELNEGTTVTISFPYEELEEDSHETTDRKR